MPQFRSWILTCTYGFVWYVAKALALAGKAMKDGAIPDKDDEVDLEAPSVEDWNEIVHRLVSLLRTKGNVCGN